MTRKFIKDKGGLVKLKDRITQNCKDLVKMIEWNEQNGIKVFRITSDLMPHKSDPEIKDYNFDFVKDILKEAGDLANKYK